jgi:hypothetical protein
MRANESRIEVDAAFGTIFRISICLQRSQQKLHIHFSLALGRQKI